MATLAPSLRALFEEVNRLAPQRSKVSDGWVGDLKHTSRKSDHNPGARALVHAIDVTHDPAHGVDCNVLAERLKDDPRVAYVIWNRRIYNCLLSPQWRRYTGSNAHDKHCHISIKSLVSAENDTRPWLGQPRVLGEEDNVPLVDVMADPAAAKDKGGWALLEDGTVRAFRGARILGDYPSLPEKDRQGTRKFLHFADELNAKGGYDLVSTAGVYSFPVQ